MVDIKEAVLAAKTFAANTLGVDNFLLEEVQSGINQFEITLSFPKRAGDIGLSTLAALREPREFKKFDVDKETGEVLGMSIRKL